MNNQSDYREGERVRHTSELLHDATFEKWSESGKRVGVSHNYLWPYGVGYKITYFDPKSIERLNP